MAARHHDPIRVVIVGGGYAGLAFVRGLRTTAAGRRARVTLVDRNDFHTLLTETHTVAAGHRAAAAVRIPYAAIAGFDLYQAEVTGMDPAARRVHTRSGPLSYDYLVVAPGARDRDFGIPGVREHTLTLRGEADARRIRQRLSAVPPEAPVIVAGGGLTGVELAAELALAAPDRPVTLLEAGAEMLNGLPARVQRRARRRLEQLGVAVRTGAPVTAAGPGWVDLSGGERLPAALAIWCAGVGGHALAGALGVPLDGAGRVPVDPYLRARPDIYVIGDSAAWGGQAPSAQLAQQMGLGAGADLARRLAGRPGRPFRYRSLGTLLELGRWAGAGTAGRVQVFGTLAWTLKRVALVRRIWADLGWRALLHYLFGGPAGVRRRGSHSGSRLRAHLSRARAEISSATSAAGRSSSCSDTWTRALASARLPPRLSQGGISRARSTTR